MPDYRVDKTKEFEKRCLDLLKAIGIKADANNQTSNDIDIKVVYREQELFADFQYSADFNKYGELRIDYISAYMLKSHCKSKRLYEIESMIKADVKRQPPTTLSDFNRILTNYFDINKFGKMDDTNLNSVIYFIFNKADSDIKITDIPDIIVVVKRDKLRSFVEQNIKALIEGAKFKLNDKSALGDTHGSAFFAIPLASFVAWRQCFVFYTKDLQASLFK